MHNINAPLRSNRATVGALFALDRLFFVWPCHLVAPNRFLRDEGRRVEMPSNELGSEEIHQKHLQA